MGDLRDWSPERNGAILFSSPSSSNPNSEAIVAGSWGRAESATQKIISRVQPTGTSENRRSEVIDYVQKLIRGCLGCEVFPFGSVPLRTYLPDGDIDLTAFGGCNVEDALANGLRSVLESEEQNKAAKFTVKDVQLIRAEVKLVKCLVQNIVVDISFNQIGGLCTLCFLEQVDRLIGKDHLFKRSIILIKAWCYYESRILGAHHGLISTYALETLVLYIFHFFHSSLNGPLAVLYKFLDYFSKFDWDNYCISLNGPVRISSLPEIVVEAPPHSGSDLLLSSEFLRESVERFSVSSKLSETNFRAFSQKHLNIVDPLRENNNLGRSVSKGNFYRIRSAFTYGARKLGRILIGPVENVGDEIQKFFGNTLDRHGSGQRPDVQGPVSFSGYNVFDPAMPLPSIDTCSEDKITSESESADPKYAPSPFGLDKKICDNNNAMIPIKTVTDSLRDCTGEAASTIFSESTSHAQKMAISGDRVVGDAVDLATFKTQDLKISEESDNASSPRNEMSPLPMTKILLHAPHLYFSHSNSTNGEVKGESPDRKQLSSWKCIDTNISTEPIQVLDKETGAEVDNRVDESQSHSGLGPVGSKDDFHPGYRENVSLGFRGSPHTLNALPSLSGDYESHLNSLQYGQWFCEYAGSTTLPPMPSPLPSQIYNGNSSWDAAIRWPTQFRPNLLSCLNANGVPALFYPVNSAIVPGAATCCMEERPKSRGTGTYFPNASHYKDRPTTPRGRNNSQLRSPRSNCHGLMLPESNLTERSDHDPASPLQVPLPLHQGGGKPRSSEYSHSGFPGRKANLHANGWIPPFERVPELGNLPLETPSLESDRHSGHLNPSPFQRSNSSVSTAGTQRQKPFPGKDTDRVAIRSYHLKNDDDFPPLSV